MKNIYLTVFLMIFLISHAQTKTDFKSEKSSFLSKKKISKSVLYYCDRDEDYYSNDTLILFSSTSFNTCKNYKSWNFLSNSKIGITAINHVEGTHSTIAGEPFDDSNVFKYKIKKFNNDLYLLFYHKRKLVDKLKIIDIQNSGIFEIVLVRVKD